MERIFYTLLLLFLASAAIRGEKNRSRFLCFAAR